MNIEDLIYYVDEPSELSNGLTAELATAATDYPSLLLCHLVYLMLLKRRKDVRYKRVLSRLALLYPRPSLLYDQLMRCQCDHDVPSHKVAISTVDAERSPVVDLYYSGDSGEESSGNVIGDFYKNFSRSEYDDIAEEAQPNEAPPPPDNKESGAEDAFLTETLAKIYIKQRKYQQAHAIITRLMAQYPEKNRYFADQIRFLDILIVNNK